MDKNKALRILLRVADGFLTKTPIGLDDQDIKKAYQVVAAGEDGVRKSRTEVAHWNSYGRAEFPMKDFSVEVTDQLSVNGQIYTDVASEGNDGEMFSSVLEISNMPGTTNTTPCLHVGTGADGMMSISIYQRGDRLVLMPEPHIAIEEIKLGDGSSIYELSGPSRSIPAGTL